MFEHEIKVYASMLAYCKRLAADIPEEQMAHQPAPGVNSPLWILGHLAVATDYCLDLLGQPKRCRADWRNDFGPGTDPALIPAPHPTKLELLQAIEQGHEAVTAAARVADPEAMDRPHAVPLFTRSPVQTVGELVALLMTAHVGVHLGELTYWRRLKGMTYLF